MNSTLNISNVDLRDQQSNKNNFFVINRASNSTLQDLKINECSGVFTYNDSDDFNSVTSNRYLVWRTCDDVLELSELSLNKNLLFNQIKIQFKNTLILQNGVSVHETVDKIYVLVTTLVSAHRLVFPHPNKLFVNQKTFPSASSYRVPSGNSSSDLLAYSIFYNVQAADLDSDFNFAQLSYSSTQNAVLGTTSSVPYLATTSWVSQTLETYFVVSNQLGSLIIVKMPPVDLALDAHAEVKTQTFDLKQNNLIGKLFNGFVPSLMKSSSGGAVSAISLLSFCTRDDDLVLALCRDLCIRVISLRRQECLIEHSLFHQPNAKDSSTGNINPAYQSRKPISMKIWWPKDDPNAALPNLVVYVSGLKLKSFLFYELILPQFNSTTSLSSVPAEPHLRHLIEVFSPIEFDLIDYFVCDEQLWSLWHHNDSVNLHYYSIANDSDRGNECQSLEWVPVMSDVNASPEMSLRSSLVNSREYYLTEIFWRGHFSLATIAKAISVLNRARDELYLGLKIDSLLQESIKIVDNIIRNQLKNQLELTANEYTKMELDAWHQLYLFCLEYHTNENKPLSIFVDFRTGVKGIVRKARVEFVSLPSAFDDLINHYFLHCKLLSNKPHSDLDSNGDIPSMSHQMSLFSTTALEYRLNTLMASDGDYIGTVSSSELEKSILTLLNEMAEINAELQDEDLLNFEALMNRMLNFSSKTELSIADIAKMITEDSLLPEMTPLSDSKLIDNFFEKCPLVAEAISFLLAHISFDTFPEKTEQFNEEINIHKGLQYEIKPIFFNLLSSQCGLEFVATNIGRTVQSRYKFCRDLFLIQFCILKFRVNLRNDYRPIMSIETELIPQTAQLLFALDYLCWVSDTSMITPNILGKSSDSYKGLTSIVTTSPSSTTGATIKSSSVENNELLSVLELREYINLNRVGILTHESTFYDAYPASNILHFFIQFSGGILAKRLLSYKIALENRTDSKQQSYTGIWSHVMANYLASICQLLWPLSAGQFKLAEFLLGVGQYDLLERYVQRLNTWCMSYSSSRFFLKGICYLVSGDGQKAICQFNRAVFHINTDPFLHRIFSQKSKVDQIQLNDAGDEDEEDEEEEECSEQEGSEAVKTVEPLKNVDYNQFTVYSHLPNARTIFRYYNKLVQLLKRYSSPDHVIELVNFALKLLSKDSDPEYDEHRSSFYSTLFACHLRLGNIKQAYEAMIDNSDLEQRRICLRQFILNLCENGKLNYLVSLSYSGLEDDFVSILESKARATSTVLNVMPANKKTEEKGLLSINYYYILYTYFIKVSNFRRAAQAVYDYHRRLSHETSGSGSVELLQKQADALLIARNCLKLVAPTYSWIIRNTLKRIDSVDSVNRKRKHDFFNTDQVDYKHQEKTVIDIVDEEELLCEYELVTARIRLLQRNAKEFAVASTTLTPEETVALCITACLYEQAFRVSTLFELNSLEAIFSGMTSKYIQLLHNVHNRRRIDDELLLSMVNAAETSAEKKEPDDMSCSIDLFDIFYENGSNTTKGAFISYSSLSICDRMWHLIMHYLDRYQPKQPSSSNLMRQVGEKLLANGIMIPTSLLKLYQKVHCSELIRLLITYNFLPEATQLCIDYMNGFMGHGLEYFDISHQLQANCAPLCIPLHIFDCLANVLDEEIELMKQDSQGWTAKDNEDVDCEIVDLPKIDFQQLHDDLSRARQKFDKLIDSCSHC